MGRERKLLSETQREIVIGKDKCRSCHELLSWSRVYPFDVYCSDCHKSMKYEDEIIFHEKSRMDKFVEKLVNKVGADKRTALLNEYDRLKETG